jgi:topoisomerase-4 subunit A
MRLHVLDGLLIAYLNIDAVIKIIRSEDKPKPVLMKRFKLTDEQAEAILELKLRHLARLEEMKIRGEQEALAEEQADLKRTLRSKKKLTDLLKGELNELAETHGDERRTTIVERDPAQAIDEAELITSDPITVVLSARGWARAAKGHDVDAESLSYRSGDEFLAAARGRSNQLAVFLDSTGRAYSLPAHTLPSARGQGEPLSGRLKPPDGATFGAVLIGAPEDRWVLASSAGYGFVVTLEQTYSRNKAGKVVLSVPKGALVVPAAPVGESGARVAAVSEDGRLLIFPLDELPALARGKGNKILGLPAKSNMAMTSIAVLAEDDALQVLSGQRQMTIKAKDLDHYAGGRGRRGIALPRGWRKVDRIAVA